MDTEKREFDLTIEIGVTEKKLEKLRKALEEKQYQSVRDGKTPNTKKIESMISTNEKLLEMQEKALKEIQEKNEFHKETEETRRKAVENYNKKIASLLERLEQWYDEYESIERDHQTLINTIPPSMRSNLNHWYVLPKVQPRKDWHLWNLKPKGLEKIVNKGT